MPVVMEVELPVAHCRLALALQTFGLAGFGNLRGQCLQEVSGELCLLYGVELGRVRAGRRGQGCAWSGCRLGS